MSAVDGLGVVVGLGLVAYAVLGGADFGAGLWDLTGDRAQRDLVARAVGPVWEANHVWLIFVVITLFTGFPGAFGALSVALAGPLSVALLGIVLRGAAFVFRQYGAPFGGRPVRGTALWGRVFAVSSLLTPFAFGTAAGGLVSGTLRADGSTGMWTPFLAPLPLLSGLLAVTCCGYLAAVYLSRDAERVGSARLVARFRRRALGSGVVAGALAPVAPLFAGPSVAPCAALSAALFAVARPAPPGGGPLGATLHGAALAGVAVSATGGVLALVLLWRRRHGWARVAAACAPAGLLAGWAMVLYPWALPGQVRLADAAAPTAVAGPVLVVLVAGLLVVAPCYAVMLRVLRARPEHDPANSLPEGSVAPVR